MEKISNEVPEFKVFEQAIFMEMCRVARELISEQLKKWDQMILAQRDTDEYRMVNTGETTIKTMMGEVTYSRRYYKTTDGTHVFLLDELMGIDGGCGLYSENLIEQTVIECAEKSYRKAAASISSLTGQSISAMGAWGILQNFGEKLAQQEIRLKELDAGGSTGHLGNIESRVIMQEMDDVWLSMQNEKRQKQVEKPTDEAAASETDIEADYEEQENIRMVRELVSGMPEKHRIPTILYYTAELSLQEIADTLNIPVGTVKSRLHTARKHIEEGLVKNGF
jgi:RNA polymerase sigma factor (sigma-70 family)